MKFRFRVSFFICLNILLLAAAEMRVWTDQDGSPFAGEFYKSVFGKVMVRDSESVVRSIPMEDMSAVDLEYLFYHVPPKLEIRVKRGSRELPKYQWSSPDFNTILYTFTAQIKKVSQLEYKGALFVEFFILGQDLQRRSDDSFVLMRYSRQRFSFSGESQREKDVTLREVRFYNYLQGYIEVADAELRGKEYAGYLIVVSDINGRMIAYEDGLPSESWMTEDIPKTATEFRRIYAAGSGAVDSCHFDSRFRNVSPQRIPWFERSEKY